MMSLSLVTATLSCKQIMMGRPYAGVINRHPLFGQLQSAAGVFTNGACCATSECHTTEVLKASSCQSRRMQAIKRLLQQCLHRLVAVHCHVQAQLVQAQTARVSPRQVRVACRLCKDFPRSRRPWKTCNVWVFCADPSGECWSADIWPHETGECWLKFQEDWDGDMDTLILNGKGEYSSKHRKMHPTSPPVVPWTAGALPDFRERARLKELV